MTNLSPNAPCALVIHGGSGNITPQNLPPDQEAACRAVLTQVLHAGHARLKQGASSLDVVEGAVRDLEDCPFFNAGKGASFTHEGTNELDAAIMDGATLRAGAVAGVCTLRNPISAARAVMEHSPYVLLIGRGAEAFAATQNLEIVDAGHFWTQVQFDRLQKARAREGFEALPSTGQGDEKFGTVGAAALDQNGDLAAATSTGGMINKRFGRVGDSPLIGAGTYASNATCAVSATGHGEHFICQVAAYDIAALIEYRGLSLQEAAEEVVLQKLAKRGADGGVIAVDKQGHITMTFNSAGMFRGGIGANGAICVAIFRE